MPAKKPQDHKRKESGRFTYPTPHGTIDLPTYKKLPFGLLMDLTEHEDDWSEMRQVVELVKAAADGSPESLAIIRRMDSDEIAEFFEAWQGVSTGESSASPS